MLAYHCHYNPSLDPPWQRTVSLTPLLCGVRFPGSDFAWNAVNDVTDVDLLSDASIYVSTHQQCENQAYNISNGDLFRWKDVSASTSLQYCIANALQHHHCTALKPAVKQLQMCLTLL